MNSKLLIAAIFTFPLLLQHILHLIPAYPGSWLDDAWVQFFLCLPVYLIGVWHFGRSSYQALRQGVFHMDLLIFIGSTAAFFYSLYGTFISDHNLLFFETSAMIITLVLTGNYIEGRTVRKTRGAIDALKRLEAEYALRIDPASGMTEKIPVSQLKTDDRVQINEGDTFPADGIILSGEAWVDESMISGESDPVWKTRQDEVIGATLVRSGSLKVQITRTGSDTILQRIIELVKRAQREKPPVQRLADRISGVFVPVVLSISVITFLVTYYLTDAGLTRSVLNSIAVLVISCPCAMGLATPTAIAAGLGRLSREGILIKSGRIMELFARVRHIIFDKTGTLTNGEFRVESFECKSVEPDKARQLIYSLENHSSHPIARSLRDWVRKTMKPESIDWKEIREIKGKGVEGLTEDGTRYFFGSDSSDHAQGKRLGLWENNELVAWLDISDDLRPHTRESIQSLKQLGLRLSLLSGDQEDPVRKMADSVGMDEYFARQSPENKHEFIKASNETQITAMVGDGINDAAALSRAGVGISLSQASDIAINSADIVLLNPDLSLIPRAYKISRATLQTIQQNLFWAFSYNLIAIPLAALGFLNPMWGAIFMTFSDIMVVGNSIRLIYRKIT